MPQGKFATAINCMDGRTQQPVIDWLKEHRGVDYVDMITETGADGVMANREADGVALIKKRVLISIQKHGSETILVAAHGDCAGNPVSKNEHLSHLRRAMELLRIWDLPVEVIGVWLDEPDWTVEVIATISKP